MKKMFLFLFLISCESKLVSKQDLKKPVIVNLDNCAGAEFEIEYHEFDSIEIHPELSLDQFPDYYEPDYEF